MTVPFILAAKTPTKLRASRAGGFEPYVPRSTGSTSVNKQSPQAQHDDHAST